MASLTRSDPLQDVGVLVHFDFVRVGESTHSPRTDSSRTAQAGRTCKVLAGQASTMARGPLWKRWSLWRKRAVTAPAHEPGFVVAMIEAEQQPGLNLLLPRRYWLSMHYRTRQRHPECTMGSGQPIKR